MVGWVAAAGAAEPSADVVRFLQHNQAVIELDAREHRGLNDLFNPTTERLYLLGEVHGVAVNYPLDLALLRYFHDAAGIRFYLSEISHAHAWWLNRFLETGDDAILQRLFGHLRGFVDCSEERREFLLALRRWNQTLPERERVRMVGFDLERMPGISLDCLSALLSESGGDEAQMTKVRRIEDALAGPDDLARPIVEQACADFSRQRSLFAKQYGEAVAFDFEQVLTNLRDRGRCQADRARFDQRRDEVMVDNFLVLAKHEGFSRIYGRAGSAHVLQRSTGGVDHFSARLNATRSSWAGHVVGIWPLYAESRHLSFTNARADSAAVRDDGAALAPFVAASSAPLTLFRLTGPDSPFAKQRLIPAEATESVTTDYFQYAVLVQRGESAVPFNFSAFSR